MLPARKTETLLTCIALVPGSHSRDHFSNLLWSERSEQQVRNSLRQALSALKKLFDAFDSQPLQIERTTVFLANQSIEIDAVRLQNLLDERTPQVTAEAIADANASGNFTHVGYRCQLSGCAGASLPVK